jgi:hypothetical protein
MVFRPPGFHSHTVKAMQVLMRRIDMFIRVFGLGKSKVTWLVALYSEMLLQTYRPRTRCCNQRAGELPVTATISCGNEPEKPRQSTTRNTLRATSTPQSRVPILARDSLLIHAKDSLIPTTQTPTRTPNALDLPSWNHQIPSPRPPQPQSDYPTALRPNTA